MQDAAYQLPRTPVPRNRVHRAKAAKLRINVVPELTRAELAPDDRRVPIEGDIGDIEQGAEGEAYPTPYDEPHDQDEDDAQQVAQSGVLAPPPGLQVGLVHAATPFLANDGYGYAEHIIYGAPVGADFREFYFHALR
jgi:hypothetical protein